MSKEQEPATAAGKIVMGAAAQLRDMAAPATGLHGDSLTGEWTVEDSGGSNPMKRIMCGEQKIIGWTMHPYSESFDAIKNAHNAALAAEREKGLKLLGGTVNRPDLMNE